MYCIYKLTNPETGLSYIGYTNNFNKRISKHKDDLTVGCKDFISEIILDKIPSHTKAIEMEKIFIDLHDTFKNGANQNRGGGGPGEHTEETRKNMSKSQQRRVKKGNHHFLGGEITRKNNEKRLKNGSHNFLDKNFQRENALKRLKDGSHHFLDKGKTRKDQKKRVADGTHHLLGGEIQSKSNKKRVEDGTHNFLGKTPKSTLILANLTKAKYKVVYQYSILIPKTYWESMDRIHRQRKLTREGFFDKDVSDTSQSEQLTLF